MITEGGLVIPFKGYPTFAGCVVAVTNTMRDGFALVVQSPKHPFGSCVLTAWKRRPKMEKWDEEQYQRDVFSLSERRGFGIAHSYGVALISGC